LVLTQQPQKNHVVTYQFSGKPFPIRPRKTSPFSPTFGCQTSLWSQVAERECGTARKRLARPKVSEKKTTSQVRASPKNGQALSEKKHIIKNQEKEFDSHHNKKHELKFMAAEFSPQIIACIFETQI